MGIINYIKETKGELKHVSWPTKSQAIAFTLIVVVVSVVVSFFLGFFDFLFTRGLEMIIDKISF